MRISPQIQAKIDSLSDEGLKAHLLDEFGRMTDTPPEMAMASDEQVFDVIVAGYQMATEQRARLRKWQKIEVIAFIDYFKAQAPDLYARYLEHEKELREELLRDDEEDVIFDADLWWDIKRLALNWMSDFGFIGASDLKFMEASDLVSGTRDYAKAHLI